MQGAGRWKPTGHFAPGYSEFIKSAQWKLWRESYFTRHIKACQVCGSAYHIQLHHGWHAAYWILKDELFFPLCEVHHRELTQAYARARRGRVSQLDFTRQWIAMNRKKRK